MRQKPPYRSTNISELAFTILCDKNDIKYTKRGYADFSIIKNDEIVGFVEVKPNKDIKLKLDQDRFRRFCEKFNIPFVKWTPDMKNLPEFVLNLSPKIL